ncbi:MAG: DUF1318 domain-containing protein [Thermodesulfobacteriota bacterium]
MRNITTKLSYLSLLIFSVSLISCATITVNVYFPAEEVKQAYTNLEEEFLLEDVESTPDSTGPQTPPPGSDIREYFQEEPTITVTKVVPITGKIDFDLINKAFAKENIAKTIEVELKKMPNVVKAFQSRASRKGKVDALLGSGKVGEGNKGMLVARGSLTAADKSVMSAENANRKTIINGMTIAILKLNNLDNTPANNKKVYPEAAEQFAATRRDASKSGWQVQLPNGKWASKR